MQIISPTVMRDEKMHFVCCCIAASKTKQKKQMKIKVMLR